jgi:hypothetical protein
MRRAGLSILAMRYSCLSSSSNSYSTIASEGRCLSLSKTGVTPGTGSVRELAGSRLSRVTTYML